MTREIPVNTAPRARAVLSGPARVRGVGLIEVMVSVLVLAVGLLGIAAMQSVALRGGQGSLESSQAVMQATSIIESMRANRANAASYNTTTMKCTAADGASINADVGVWIGSLKSTIGNDAATCGQIVGCPNACVVTVQWNDSRAGGSATRTVITETRI